MNLNLTGVVADEHANDPVGLKVGGCEVTIVSHEMFSGNYGESWKVVVSPVGSEKTLLNKYFKTDEVGKKSIKKFLKAVAVSNEGVLSANEIESGVFDDKKIIGLKVGTVLKYNTRGYFTPTWFDTVEKCKAYVPTEEDLRRPTIVDRNIGMSTGAVASKDLPF